jgi:hypothetical protein
MRLGGNDPFPLFLGALMVAFLAGCKDYTKQYGLAYNAERAKRGIPTVPVTWEISGSGRDFDCVNIKVDYTKPYHLAKRVFVGPNGIIASEVDTYFSGKSFATLAGDKVDQEVFVYYDYTLEKAGNPWRIDVSLDPDQFLKDVSLQEGDQILRSWGLSR